MRSLSMAWSEWEAERCELPCSCTEFASRRDKASAFGDVYEVFHLALRKAVNPKLPVRAEHNRLLADGQGHLCLFWLDKSY